MLEDSWHPKITPYRFLVFVFTIGLGTAKTIAVFNNLSLAAIHIEWVTGVIIFPIMFFLGLYEYETECTPPASLKWLISSDLVPIIFRVFSRPPPQHRTDEVQQFFLADYNNQRPFLFPPVTGYRVLTTVFVCLFGIPKAYLVSQEKLYVASVLEWSFGTVVTSLLYILGLYERNPVNLMPSLFSTDYSIIFTFAMWFMVLAAGISLFPVTVWFLLPPTLSKWSTELFNGNRLNLGLFIVGVALLLAAALYSSFSLLKVCWVMSPAPMEKFTYATSATSTIRFNLLSTLGFIIASVFWAGCACIFLQLGAECVFGTISSWESAQFPLYIVKGGLAFSLIFMFGFAISGVLISLGVSLVFLVCTFLNKTL